MARLTILLAALCVFEFIAVSWSEDADCDPYFPQNITQWEPKLKEIFAIKDPVEKLQALAKLGQEASQECALDAISYLDPSSPRAAAAEKYIRASTTRVFNDFVDGEFTDALIAVKEPDDSCAEKFMNMWMTRLNNTCNNNQILADLSNDYICAMY